MPTSELPEIYGLAPPPVTPAADCAAGLDADGKKAVEEYTRKLGPALRERHGQSDYYTRDQVSDTIRAVGLLPFYSCYGFAMFCSPMEFHAIHSAAGEACDYLAMRGQVAEAFFGGNMAFDLFGDGVISGIADAAEGAANAGANFGGWVLSFLEDVDWG